MAKDILKAGQCIVKSYGNNKLQICKIGKNGRIAKLSQLESSHDEADGVLLHHAFHAASSSFHPQVIMVSPDTDVVVLAIHFARQGACDLRLKTDVKTNICYMNINSLVQKLGDYLCEVILPFHCLLGTDNTSFLCGRGRCKGETWKHLERMLMMSDY